MILTCVLKAELGTLRTPIFHFVVSRVVLLKSSLKMMVEVWAETWTLMRQPSTSVLMAMSKALSNRRVCF